MRLPLSITCNDNNQHEPAESGHNEPLFVSNVRLLRSAGWADPDFLLGLTLNSVGRL